MPTKRRLRRKNRRQRRMIKNLRRTIKNQNCVDDVSTNRVLGVAFAGGGFRAHSIHTGIVSALIKGKGLQGLFKNVDHLSSNSGGSWFAAQLLHSSKFNKMIEDISASKSFAGEEYMINFIKPMEESFNKITKPLPPLPIVDTLLDFDSLLGEIVFAIKSGLDWTNFIQRVITSTTDDFDPKKSLKDSKSLSWCSGKTWSIVGGVSTALSSDFPIIYGVKSPYSIHGTSVVETNEYTPPIFSPFAFHVSLTDNSRGIDNSPFRGCSKTTQTLRMKYAVRERTLLSSEFGPIKNQSDTSTEGDLCPWSDSRTNQVRLIDAISASSSAGGILSIPDRAPSIINDKLLELWKILTNVTAHSNLSENPDVAFENANTLRKSIDTSDTYLSAIKDARLSVMGDGATVDGTGVNQLVANGVDNILCIIDTSKDKQFLQMFVPDSTPVTTGFSPVPLFHETQSKAEELLNQNGIYMNLPKPKFLEKFLVKSIRYAEINVNTTKSKPWGTEDEDVRQITLNVIIVDSSVSMGAIEWESYGKVVSEIQTIFQMPENANTVSKIMNWFGN